MGALDISIVGPAIPSIEKAIKIDTELIGWIFSIYVLFNLVGIQLFAKLSDTFGRSSVYAASVSIFAIGSLWVALSSDYTSILIGRAIQGFGSSGIFPVASAVIGDKFPPEKRGRMLGLIGMVFGLAFILGPIIAGVLLLFFPWNSLFLINIPIALYLVYTSFRVLPKERISTGRSIDIPGVVLMALTLGSVTLLLNNLKFNSFSNFISSPFIIALIVTAIVSFVLLMRIELRHEHPVLNVRYFKSRQIRIAGMLAIGTGFFQALFAFLPSLAVHAFGVTNAKASFMLIPTVLFIAVGSPLFGRVLDSAGSKRVIILGMIFMSIGLLLNFLFIKSIVFFFIAGAFIGLAFSILSGSALRYILLNETKAEDRASSQGIITIFVSIGQMVNAAIIGTIVASKSNPVLGFKYNYLFLLVVSSVLLVLSFFLKDKRHEASVVLTAQ